jgi:hypothetical protein
MDYKLPFKFIFSPDYNTEIEINDFESGKVRGITFFKTTYESVNISAIFLKEKGWQIRIFNSGDIGITGFWGICFPWKHGADAFTIIPGIYYNGNVQKDINNIPILDLPSNCKFSASLSATAFPAVLTKENSFGISYEISHKTEAGWSGVELDGEKSVLTFFVPAKEEKKYTHKSFQNLSRLPYTLNPKSDITFTVDISQFDCKNISDLFDFYWNFATIVSQAFTLSPFFTHTSVPNGKNKSILEPNFINPTCEHWSALSPAFA